MILMHKNVPVAEIEIKNNAILNFSHIYNFDELPMGINNKSMGINTMLIKSWIKTRTVPNGRPGIENIIKKLGMTLSDASIKSMGLSLTDTYWFKEKESLLQWEDVNFHDNGFYPVFAHSYFVDELKFEKSPDYTTDGEMEKFWISMNNQAFLCKKDNQFHNTQIANEVFIYKLCSLLDIPCTPYFKSEIKGNYLCMTPNFVKNSNTDYFNAIQVLHEDFSRTGDSLFLYIKNKMGFGKELEQMKYIDLLTKQQDRHLKNIGFLKEGNHIRFVPLFDNGNCLGFNGMKNNNDYKPFNKTFDDVAQDLTFIPDINESEILNLLKEVYEDYKIQEQFFEIAKSELVDSNLRLIEAKENFYMEEDITLE